jgi:hypothetical protein
MAPLQVQDVNQLVRALSKFGHVNMESIDTGFYHLGLGTQYEDECMAIINEWKNQRARAYVHQDSYAIEDNVSYFKFVLSNQ